MAAAAEGNYVTAGQMHLRHQAVVNELVTLPARQAIIDGEMVALRPDGTCDYWALHSAVKSGESERVRRPVFEGLVELPAIDAPSRKPVAHKLAAAAVSSVRDTSCGNCWTLLCRRANS